MRRPAFAPAKSGRCKIGEHRACGDLLDAGHLARGIIGASQKFQFLVVTIAGVVMVLGVGQLPNMPVDVFPEFDLPSVEFQTEALGLSTAPEPADLAPK